MIFQVSYNNFAEKLVFPVSPPDYKISGGGTNFNDFNVIKGGEATIIGDEALMEVAFSSFFPRDYDPYLCNTTDIPAPWEAVKTIERWRKSKWPVRLIISGTDINMPCTIRQFEYEERGGEPGDIYFNVSFKEYKFIKIREIVQAVEPEQPRPDVQQPSKTYTVVSGDTLWGIAKRFYGNGNQYPKIHEANRGLIGSNPNLIHIGWVLTIP